jgi:hypothetical protein
MVKRLLALGLLVGFSAVFLTSCGSSSSSSTPSGPAPLAIMVGDVPLCGVLSFRTLVNGLTLVPQSGSGVEVLSSNDTVPLDFAALRDTASVLDITTIQPGTYTSATITLIAPSMSIFNTSVNPAVTVLTPTFSSETITFNINPPLVVPSCPLNSTNPCTAGALQIDFNLAQSIPVNAQGQIATSGAGGTQTLTVTPVLTGAGLTATANQGFGELDDVKGYIMTVNNTATSSGNTNFIGSFVVQTLPGTETSNALQGAGPELTVNLASAKALVGVPTLNQLTTGNFVEVQGHVDAYANFVASSVVVENQEDITNNLGTFEGYILSISKDSSGNVTQFDMTVTDEEPNTETAATAGNPVPFDLPPLIVSVSSVTGWHFSSPGLNFANLAPGPTDLALGEHVIVHGTYVPPPTVTPPATAQSTTLTAHDIYFPIQTVSGNYASLLAAGTDNLTGGFLFNPCSGLYQGQPIYVFTSGQLQSDQSPLTLFVNLNGLAGLAPPPQLLVRGLLFLDQPGGTLHGIQIPPNSYVMLANKVHQL